MEFRSKEEKLYTIAEQDHIYNVWKKCYEDSSPSFKAFVQEQPDEIKNILLGYADCGRMMMQRIINIACETMGFVAEEKLQL